MEEDKETTFWERNKTTFTGFVGLDDQADVRDQCGDILLIDGSNKNVMFDVMLSDIYFSL